ncbi:MAG: flavin reductase family protein [Candidatus Bathyarchaeota archaeon]|nr:flavin reductase family protein [Candidatus Bathyarchaeota archaeon A05DMB-3]MDH7607522.1 flavin reductase family protein [Candidatus Bathyarchaeota archaeon]
MSFGKEVFNVGVSSAYRLLHPMHTVLVSCVGKSGKLNIITLAWAMPTSINPPLVAISIAPRRHSHTLIEETREFVVNIPTMNILKETLFCGRVSGKGHDKFKEAGLTPLPARKVKPPIIGECVAHLECKLHSQFTTGDHTIFIGEILEAYANKNCFTEAGYNLEKAKMVFHLGGNEFATLQPRIFTPQI